MSDGLMISVIVPIYNGEKTVRRAIESILCQMDGRIELILVDDGSTDSSGAICDEYSSRHEHIHVLHKSNGGTSSAKNCGLEIAKGRYISFMDSDDFFEPDTFEQIIPVLLEYQPDCLDFGFHYVNVQGDVSENMHQCRKNVLLPLQELETVILPPLLNLRKDDDHFVFDFCWNKIFKADIIQANQVRFDEDKRTWEDRTFLLRHLKNCRNYYAMDRCFYNYVFIPNSLSQQYNLEYFNIIMANFSHYRELYQDRFDFDTQYGINYRAQAIEKMIYYSLEQTENRKNIHKNILDILQNEAVIQWFTKRQTNDSFQHRVSALIASGNGSKALCYYKKRVVSDTAKQTIHNTISRFKLRIRKIIGR